MNPIFIYCHQSTGELRAEYLAQAQILEYSPEWEHLETVEPSAYVLHLQAENAELRKQLAAAEKDAARYRWLRVNNIIANIKFHYANGESPYVYAEVLDESIDAAIAEGK